MSVVRITPEQALDLLENEGFAYVDVRSVPEFEAGHPEGAYNVPWKHRGATGLETNPEFLAVMQACFAKDAKLVLGCQAGGRSQAAAEALVAAGWTDVRDQLAGWGGARDAFGKAIEPGWMACGLPMGLEADPGRSYEELRARVR